MLDAKLLHSLPQLPQPILTAYLDTNPANPRNQGHPPGALIWLKSRARVLRSRIPKAEQKPFQEQVRRVEELLRNQPPRERGLVVFAGPESWQVIPLQVDVEDELHWGRPSLTQLLWLLDEHQPCGAALVDRSGARFYKFWMGFAEEQEKFRFQIDLTEWRKKYLVPPAHPGVQKTRGSQRDVFEQRVEAQLEKFYKETANRIQQWATEEKLIPVVVAGPQGTVDSVWDELPRHFQERCLLVRADLSHLAPADLAVRLEQEIKAWKRDRERQMVERLLANPNGTRAVVGPDETLRRIQEGMARELVVVRGLGGRLRQCQNCFWVDRSADRICPACGGERRLVPLRAVLPELARRYNVHVEVIAGEAARKLREFGGLAAWLR